MTGLDNHNRIMAEINADSPLSSPTSADGSSSGEGYTPTELSNEIHILRISIALMCILHQRAFNGFVEGDTHVAINAVNQAVQDAQAFRDRLPENAPNGEAAFARARYWQGLVAYYADDMDGAWTHFTESESLIWTHADRSNLQGWIDKCQSRISVDKRKEAYMPRAGKKTEKMSGRKDTLNG